LGHHQQNWDTLSDKPGRCPGFADGVPVYLSGTGTCVESCHSEQYMPKYPIYDQAYRPIQQQKTERLHDEPKTAVNYTPVCQCSRKVG